MTGYLPVRIDVPLHEYRELFAEAERRGMTVAGVLWERAQHVPVKRGRPNGYKATAGRHVDDARSMGVSWPVIAARFGVDVSTVREWRERFLNESKERETA